MDILDNIWALTVLLVWTIVFGYAAYDDYQNANIINCVLAGIFSLLSGVTFVIWLYLCITNRNK